MEDKLKKVLKFLQKNKKHNIELQIKYMQTVLCSKTTNKEKTIALLYDTASTQSQPKMDKLAPLFRRLSAKPEKDFDTFEGFLTILNKDQIETSTPYKTLYELLKEEDGWGEKTSALFVKNMYNLHHNSKFKYTFEGGLWEDMPSLDEGDSIYLPVDAVILAIFTKLDPSPPKWTFSKINKKLKELGFSNEEIIRFDDLWFWGYITQDNSKGKEEDMEYWDDTRKMLWNEDKYWMIKEANKEEKYIAELHRKANDFLELFKSSQTNND